MTRKLGRKLGRKKNGEIIFDLIKQNPQLTLENLAQETGLTFKGVEWNVNRLKAKGLIKRVGPDKGGHWEIQG